MDNDRGQSLISKYVWVIETIYRRGPISFKELNERWLRDDISRGVEIPKRTFDNWKYVIWDMFGISIVNENRGEYRYYIENEEDISKNGLRSWLYNTASSPSTSTTPSTSSRNCFGTAETWKCSNPNGSAGRLQER